MEIKQSARSLNDATVDFKLEVEAGNVIYNKGEKLLSWSMANAKTESNSFGEIKIIKGEPGKRIDPVDAVIDAHKLILSLNETTFDVAQAANDYLEMMGW
ncbi:Phage Terminase [compost metagenome]